jgi:hypothetical protein
LFKLLGAKLIKANHRFSGLSAAVRVFASTLLFVFFCLLEFNPASAETINWNATPDTNLLAGSDVRASAPVGVTLTTTGATAGVIGGNVLAVESTTSTNGHTGVIRMQMDASATTGTDSQTTTFTFSEPVYNLSFTVIDLDGGTTYNNAGSAWNDWVYLNSNAGLPTSVVPNTPANVTWNAAQGRAEALSNTNITDTTGDILVTFAGPVTSVTVRHVSAPTGLANPTNQWVFIDDLTFQRAPRLAVQKTSTGGIATFSYNISNSGSGTTATTVTTAVAGTAVVGTQIPLNTINTATTITETGPTGWILTPASSTCTDANSAASGNPATFAATVTGFVVTVPAANIRPGAVITCPITNAKRPTVQVVKTTTGGTGSFTFNGDNGFGSDTIATTAVSTPVSGVVKTLTAAATVTTITESLPAGWQAVSATCTGTAAANVSFTAATATLVLNATATAASNALVCTFTNNDIAPRVTLLKTVTNDNGGTAVVSAYTLAATGPTPISGVSGSPAVTSARVLAGSYTLTETGPTAGYAGTWSCPGSTLTSGNILTVAANQSAICTINNNDVAPILTLIKTITNDNGGTAAVGSFPLTATGPTTITGVSGTAAVTAQPVTAGTYVLSETNLAGYAASAWTCTGTGTLTGSSLALGIGQTANCTINNNDIAPTMTLAKKTNGSIGSFNFSGTNGFGTDVIATSVAGITVNGATKTLTLGNAATDIIETVTAGFLLNGPPVCTGMGSGGTVTLVSGTTYRLNAAATAPGSNIICTFTNDKIPTVSVQKTTTAGFGGPFTFTQTGLASAPANITTAAAATPTPAVLVPINATIGTAVALTEGVAASFATAGVVCTDSNSLITSNPIVTSATASVTIPSANIKAGATYNCVFTNTKLPTVTLTKLSNGGVGPFTFFGTNGFGNQTITTTTFN